jgi:Fe-S cluster assembly ATPase SufC
MINGKIVKSGKKELALELEERGYEDLLTEVGEPAGAAG